MTNVCTGQI